MKRTVILLLLAAAVLCSGKVRLAAQGAEHHGADSTFQVEGLVFMWAILRAADEPSTQVVLDIVKTSPAAERFRLYSVQAVDPFTGESRTEVEAARLEEKNRVLRPRPEFQIFSNRRILLFTDERSVSLDLPELTVFYQGVPDTSPEFSDIDNLEAYFQQVLQRIR
ncbi:MAG: hypothetical protein JXB06_07135 [Spirochaetales bacterium]|nr:hypothetical protein [Spirochaetales bacterium]